MEFTLTTVLAIAVVAALVALAYMIGDVSRAPVWRELRSVTPHATAPKIADVAAPCQRDGILITSLDRLRIAVTMADTMIVRGGLDGRRIGMQEIRTDADAFAQKQSAPDTTLEMLGRCDETLLQRYPHGYWLISAALVRESARRRGIIPASAR